MAAADKLTCIKDLRPGMKNVTCVFIVIDRGSTHQIKDGSVVRKCRVADKTGSVSFSLWNEQAEAIEAGDILRLVNGYASLWKGTLVLYSGKYGQLEKIGEFTMVFSELPDMSDSSHDFIQKEKETQESRHHNGRNGNSHSSHGGGESHGRSGQNSGRLGLGQHGDGKRSSYTSSPTGEYRPSPPHACNSSHTAPLVHSSIPALLVGASLHRENHHPQNSGPLRTRQPEVGGNRYHPYPNRR